MDRVDLRGKPCPLPVIEVKKLLAVVQPGESISVLVDNDIARQNLQKLAQGEGHAFSYEKTGEGDIAVTVTLSQNSADACALDDGGLVVAIGSDCMGRGSDELGATLMKSFLFSLTEQASAPDFLLFFNGGVHCTCEGSSVLEDLAVLEKKGTVIASCGACLNYYKKTEALGIGGVTNMFSIVETMARAKRLINL